MSANDALESIRAAGVIAVLRAPTAAIALDAVDALVRGGITGIEVTYSTPDTASVIARLIDRHGDRAVVGAGTVTTAEQAREAAEAGASFLVSPGTLPEVACAMRATGALTMSGALTPSEVMAADSLGVDVVKIFPASLGGPGYLSALRTPFPAVPLMPTGGVTPENLAEWFAAGALAVGAGGELLPAAALRDGDVGEIERRARRFAEALRAVG